MINSRDVKDLHPALQRGAAELKARMADIGYDMIITSTYRDNEYQNVLYAQGRTAPGQIVTNAKAGQSIHNYHLAFDICENIKGQEYSNVAFFAAAGRIWQEMGGVWGGSWQSFPDKPHMEFTSGLSLSDLQKGKTVGDVKMLWEEHIEEVLPPGLPEMITVLFNGNKIQMERIFYKNTNYVKMRDLEKLSLKVRYDSAQDLPIINK